MTDTRNIRYTERLERKSTWWKRLLDVQRPYRWNLRRLNLGYVLDIGCGIGRNLENLRRIGNAAVGVDHNRHSVELARGRGLDAMEVNAFRTRFDANADVFDSLLIAHVLEHMSAEDGVALLGQYLHLLKPKGRIVIITPQEAGFASDSTHVEFMDHVTVNSILSEAGLRPDRTYSFPFPRWTGRYFLYNEFVTLGVKPG